MPPVSFGHSFLPTRGRQTPEKLENYAQLYATYTELIQRQADGMRHDLQSMERAYHRVAGEFAEQNTLAQNKSGTSHVLADLNEYARRCDTHPQTFEDCVRISFAASGFVQILMNFVIGELSQDDMEWVMARATQLMQLSRNPNQPIPMFAPAICKLRADNAVTSSVTAKDIDHWQSNPQDLVGKCFITSDGFMRQTFLVQDYYVKRTGPHYDVVFEDTGLEDVNTIDFDSLLAMVENAELVN